MNLSVKNDLLYKDGVQVRHLTTSKSSGKMKAAPTYIVVHYTAGTSFEGDIKTLSSSAVQASCQLVVDKDGTIAQIGDFRDVLWHAGKSFWKGINGLNSVAVGIEVVNPGYVDFHHEENGVKYYNYPGASQVVKWNDRDDEIVITKHKNGGPVKNWVRFSKAQLDAVYSIIAALKAAYPIKEVVGHDMIAPERKIDPGPCVPDDFYAKANGISAAPVTTTPATPKSDRPVLAVTTANLRLRKSPVSGDVIRTMSLGTKVTILSSSGGWTQVLTSDNVQGYASEEFLKRT